MGRDASQWLGIIYYVDAHGQRMSTYAAAYCHDSTHFDGAVNEYLQRYGGTFLWSENVSGATHWDADLSHANDWAGQVDASHPVALFDLTQPPHDATLTDNSLFEIKEIDKVEPLDRQFGENENLTVPKSLQDMMFGHPISGTFDFQPTGATEIEKQPAYTYAILDAAKMPFLLTGFMKTSDLEYKSLFQGAAQKNLGEYAPYIVKLEDGNEFTRKLFTTEDTLGLWEKNLSLFIRSSASLDALRRHFRKFTQIQDDHGKWYYFRFWDMAAWGDIHTAKNLFLHLQSVFSCPHSETTYVIKLGGPNKFIARLASPTKPTTIKFDHTLRHLFLQARMHHLAPRIHGPEQMTVYHKLDILANLFSRQIKNPKDLVAIAQASVDSRLRAENLYEVVDSVPATQFDRTDHIIQKIQLHEMHWK